MPSINKLQTEKDEKEAVRLIIKTFGKQSTEDIDDLTTRKPQSEYSHRECNVIKEKEKVVGIFGLYSGKEHPKNTAFIGWFAVKPEHRKKGLGSMALKMMEKKAKEMNKRFLYVVADAKAIDFYKKRGYVKSKAEKLKKFYFPEDCSLLFKKL